MSIRHMPILITSHLLLVSKYNFSYVRIQLISILQKSCSFCHRIDYYQGINNILVLEWQLLSAGCYQWYTFWFHIPWGKWHQELDYTISYPPKWGPICCLPLVCYCSCTLCSLWRLPSTLVINSWHNRTTRLNCSDEPYDDISSQFNSKILIWGQWLANGFQYSTKLCNILDLKGYTFIHQLVKKFHPACMHRLSALILQRPQQF